MLHYISFFTKCLFGKITFFKRSLSQQAYILQKHKLYYLAGKYYMGLEYYSNAAYCFKRCKAHKQLMYAYIALQQPSKAIELAEKHCFYEDGANLCTSIGHDLKAAQFYAYFNPLKAAKLYKKLGLFSQAGEAYLLAQQFSIGVDCFRRCIDTSERLHGLKQVEEIAITLYFKKQYTVATKLFVKLEDYESALICANHTKEPSLKRQLYAQCGRVEKLPT
ncbi:MAG: hypothetical protein ACRCTE_04600 [Cellulosilyticaceae bacterium]